MGHGDACTGDARANGRAAGVRVKPGAGPPPPEPGDRLLLPCDGGPSQSRLVHWPPPLEIVERDGMYVLVDDGPPHGWRYQFVEHQA